MEKHLITMNLWTRVEPEQNAVVKAVIHAEETRGCLVMLGTKGSLRMLTGPAVKKFTHDNYMVCAQAGLLYYGTDEDARRAFAPMLDAQSGLPQLMEPYDHAFAMRQKSGPVMPKEEQAAMDLNAPAT